MTDDKPELQLETSDGRVLVPNLAVAQSMLARLRGLLGRDGLATDEALLIERCASIHTFFMRFAIDVLFLDRNLRILAIKARLKPWRTACGPGGTRQVLELAVGAARQAKLETGQQVVLKRKSAPE